MKKIVMAVALVMMLALAVSAQEAAKEKPDAKTHAAKMGAAGDVSKTLQDMEDKMAADMKANNWTAVGEMLDNKFVAVDESGVTDKAGWLKMMGGMKMSEAAVSDMKVEPFGDTAIVTGKFKGKATDAAGKETNVDVNWMDTWKKVGGKWKVIASSGANAKAM